MLTMNKSLQAEMQSTRLHRAATKQPDAQRHQAAMESTERNKPVVGVVSGDFIRH